jgi:(2R)-ethylmalonyl-CoA mutase
VNNVQRILLEMLAVTLSKNTRARAIQLPAWNEALGLPRPWDQQWALRMQQVLALETDLLEYGDLLDGSPVVEAKVQELIAGAEAEMARVADQGGMVQAIESGYVKRELVQSHTLRMRNIESGALKIVGVNCPAHAQYRKRCAQNSGGKLLRTDSRVTPDRRHRFRHYESGRAGRARSDRRITGLPCCP